MWRLGREEYALIPEPSDQPHTRTEENGTKILSWVIAPLFLHLSTLIILITALKSYIDGNDFNLHSRTALTDLTPLQSDVTTAVSSCIALQRSFAAMWSGSMYLRCIFILMEKGGISLQQIDSLLFWKNHFNPRVKLSGRIALVVSIILLLSFPNQLSGPILTGSITWFSSSVLAREDVTFVSGGYTGDLRDKTFEAIFPSNFSAVGTKQALYSAMPPFANGLAITAWRESRNDNRTMKRTLSKVGTMTPSEIPTNSTLNNVTLPYFANTKLEWIKDPISELDPVVLQSYKNISNWNPFIMDGKNFAAPGTFAIIPDDWGVANPPLSYKGIVNETRNIVGIFSDLLFGELPRNIGLHQDDGWSMIYGRLTYVAGVAECRNCRVSSRATIQNDTEVTVSPHNLTAYALALMPKVSAMMAIQNTALPDRLNNLDAYVTELFIRSYGASWDCITGSTRIEPGTILQTNVQVAVSTSQAKVLWWRVYLWLALNLCLTVSGLLFFYIQSLCAERLIESPFMAALLLDTIDVHHQKNRSLCGFSTLVDDDKGFGYLRLQRTDEGHKHVVLE